MSILVMFLTVFSTYLLTENNIRNIFKIDQIEKLGLSIKAVVVSNFYLIGKIHHNFLVPRMIESTCQTFRPIQILDIHRVFFCQLSSFPFKKWENRLLACFIDTARIFHGNDMQIFTQKKSAKKSEWQSANKFALNFFRF